MVVPMTQASTWDCAHSPGTGTIATATAFLSVDNDPVVTLVEALTMIIDGCTNIGSGLVPCTALLTATPGSVKLTKGGLPLALETTVYATNSTPPSVLSVTSAQSKLTIL